MTLYEIIDTTTGRLASLHTTKREADFWHAALSFKNEDRTYTLRAISSETGEQVQ